MSSEIKENDSLMYYGAVPWHGLGKELKEPATAKEAIIEAGLDWKVEKVPMFVEVNKKKIEMPDSYATIRTDKNIVLGNVGNVYKIKQNVECFGFFDEVVGKDMAIYHVAGSLNNGARIWILAKLPGEMRIKKTDDITEKYLLLTTGHDGRACLKMFFTPIRVVCMNTLTQALGNREYGKGISIKHSSQMDSRVSTAQKALGIAIDYYNSLEGIMNLMAKKIIKQDKKVNDYLKVLFPDKENSENKRAENVRMQIKELYATHEFNNMKGIKDSAWALYNSVVQYVDYERASRGKDTNARMNNRLNSIWIGNGARLKDKAFRAAVELFVKK